MIPARGPQTMFFCSSLLCNLGYAILLFGQLGWPSEVPEGNFWGLARQV